MWWKAAAGGYVNGERVAVLDVAESTPGVWRIVAGTVELEGDYPSQAVALNAARTLVHGTDPVTFMT